MLIWYFSSFRPLWMANTYTTKDGSNKNEDDRIGVFGPWKYAYPRRPMKVAMKLSWWRCTFPSTKKIREPLNFSANKEDSSESVKIIPKRCNRKTSFQVRRTEIVWIPKDPVKNLRYPWAYIIFFALSQIWWLPRCFIYFGTF